jgi:hypothetical protein
LRKKQSLLSIFGLRVSKEQFKSKFGLHKASFGTGMHRMSINRLGLHRNCLGWYNWW